MWHLLPGKMWNNLKMGIMVHLPLILLLLTDYLCNTNKLLLPRKMWNNLKMGLVRGTH